MDYRLVFERRIVKPEPLPIPYFAESSVAGSRSFRVLGAVGIIFGLAELLVTLLDPAQTIYEGMFVIHRYANTNFDFSDFVRRNWSVWLKAAVALVTVVGAFLCFLRPERNRLLVLASILLILIDVYYIAAILIAGWRLTRPDHYDTVWAAFKIVSQTVMDMIFPISVICLARISTRQMRVQN